MGSFVCGAPKNGNVSNPSTLTSKCSVLKNMHDVLLIRYHNTRTENIDLAREM